MKSALQARPSAAALTKREEAWKASVERADQADAYATALDNWTGAALQAIADHAKAKSTALSPRFDSWVNALTGIGTSRDATTATRFFDTCQLSYAVLDALYHGDDMAARIADAVPEQMFREGYELYTDDKPAKVQPGEKPQRRDADDSSSAADDIEKALQDLDADEHFESCFIWGRVFGGAAVIVGADDGQDDSEPLNEQGIKAINYLEPLDRYSLFPVEWYDQPEERKTKNFGKPKVYQILLPGGSNPYGMSQLEAGQKIHESRLIMFPGARTSIRRKRYNWGWDDSVFQRVYQVLMKFGLDWAAATHLLTDASQGVLTLKGLIEAIGGNNLAEIDKRGELFDKHRTNLRTILLDADEGEKYEKVGTQFSGIPDMLDRTAQRLAAAARMPVTVLMGTSPAGLNATGDADIRNWYDQIASVQRRQLAPRLQKLIRLITLAKEGPTSGKELEVEVCFKPLYQLTPVEEADRRLKTAQKDQIEIQEGVTTPEEVATSRYGARGYSAETTIDAKLREDRMKSDDVPAPGEVPADGTEGEKPVEAPADDPNAVPKDQAAGLNGAQVTAMLEIVQAVAEEQLPRETGVAMISSSFPISPERAEEIMGKVGKGFKPKKEDPPPGMSPPFGKKPAVGVPPGAKPPAAAPKAPPNGKPFGR